MRADLPRRRSEPVQRDGEIYQFGCMRGRGGSNISQVPLPLLDQNPCQPRDQRRLLRQQRLQPFTSIKC
jgi:hypothetical protein